MRALRIARGAGVAAAAALLAAAADATLVEPNRLTTTVVPLSAGRLAAALGGERVVHLSDLHLQGIGSRERRLMDRLQGLQPALVVMTGDYADTKDGIDALRTLFADVRPRLGVVAVPGNNDYFRGRQQEIFAALRASGVTLLRNESLVLAGRGGPFAVAGVDDPFFGRDDVARALGGLPEGVPAILLAHSPAVLERRSEAMLFNAADASGAWGRGWFWQSGSHLRGANPPVSFAAAGEHTLRIQHREDGVGVGAIRLIPVTSAASAAAAGPVAPPSPATGEIAIDLCSTRDEDAHGSWRISRGEEGSCALFDGPDRGGLTAYALVSPRDYADVSFTAPPGVAYEVWVRLYSPTSTGRSDSLYIQFDDALDATGAPRFRIGSVLPAAARPGVDLVLAGHTHGGQVRLPWFGPLEETISRGPFVMGRYEVDGTMVYVSRGIGTSYLPVRFGCAPEIVVLAAPEAAARGGGPRV